MVRHNFSNLYSFQCHIVTAKCTSVSMQLKATHKATHTTRTTHANKIRRSELAKQDMKFQGGSFGNVLNKWASSNRVRGEQKFQQHWGGEEEVEIEGLVGRVVASWCQVCLLTPSNRKFVCPTKMIILRRVQLNIYWSAKSSLLEISTQKLSSSRKLVFSSNSQTTFFGTTMVRFESENLKKTYTYVIGKNLTFVHYWLAADLGKLWSH